MDHLFLIMVENWATLSSTPATRGTLVGQVPLPPGVLVPQS